MTGKGIKRLCSELLELKKASDDKFQRSVYSSYSAFVRILEEVGGVENEIIEMKKHVSAEMKLVQALTSNLYADIITDGLEETKVDDFGFISPSRFEIHMQDVLVTMDILLSECRLKEALALLEKETITLRKFQIEEDCSSSIIMSYKYALSERRKRLSDQLSFIAEHPRVSQPELQKALSELCRLGENHRAKSLLLKFYRSRLQKKVFELQCLKPCLYGTHIRELAKAVFSTISEAASCFVVLYGETTPYSSELILWTREETETFSHEFYKYVRSVSETNEGISLAIEAANSALNLCSLLRSQRIDLVSKLMEFIRPCMEEVLQMHLEHFKRVFHVFTTSDNWTLGKFLSLGILRDMSSLTGIGDKVEYCLLTSSGRKFVTLMQAIVDDVSPLVVLKLRGSILKGLAGLFSEYICALERAIPPRENATENGSPKVNSAQSLQQQLSLLANASTLAHFFPSIAGGIIKDNKFSKDDLSFEQTEFFSQNELDDCILSIGEAANQLRCYFSRQFVLWVMSHEDYESEPYLEEWFIHIASQDPVPSFVFLLLFVRLRQLEQLSKSIFIGENGMIKKLQKEILDVLIAWLSKNRELWRKTVKCSSIRHCGCLEQVYLDMHFLMEIAILGGYCSDDLVVAAMDLIEEMEAEFTKTCSSLKSFCSVVPERDWALNAAKLAIKKLLEVEAANSESGVESAVASFSDSKKGNCNDECPSDVEELINISEGSKALLDGESESSGDDDILRLTDIKHTVAESFVGQRTEVISNEYDDDGYGSPTVPCSDREKDTNTANIGTDGLCEDIWKLELEIFTIKDKVQAVQNSADFDAVVAQPREEEHLENVMSGELDDIKELETEVLTEKFDGKSIVSSDESNSSAKLITKDQRDTSNEFGNEKLMVVLESNDEHFTVSKELVQIDGTEVEDELGKASSEASSLHLEKRFILLEADASLFTEIVQGNSSKNRAGEYLVKDETNMHESAPGTDEEEKLLSVKFSELGFKSNGQKQENDIGNLIRSVNTSESPVQQRAGRKRNKSTN
ncbi:exocyst complex component EXO84B-like, partial [Asparagus officinalis]|uniref:exocyst complex component EXO84B-like n=1 Tax=Asparagus officinalis TaxID=4686 RepID=UPI00098E663A